ncbi:MAG: F0F1 ATP synthase subunit gamma, partial [Thermoplasmata archaeon]
QKLQEFLQGLSAGLDQSDEAVYSDTRNVKKVLLVVVTSNRGLCGAFNTNVIKRAETLIKTSYKDVLWRGS